MSSSSNLSSPTSTKRKAWPRRLLFAYVSLAVVGIGWGVYRGFAALQTEQNLHASLFAVSLVDEFVKTRGRWPRSWAELEQVVVVAAAEPLTNDSTDLRLGAEHGYAWLAASRELQQRIIVDFDADPDVIASQDPRSFVAIRPIGPTFDYRSSPQVRALQARLKAATQRGR